MAIRDSGLGPLTTPNASNRTYRSRQHYRRSAEASHGLQPAAPYTEKAGALDAYRSYSLRMPPQLQRNFTVEKIDESRGHCDCCGRDSRSVWGFVHDGDGPTVAAYWMHWTEEHLNEAGANLDLVFGPWGDGTGPSDRFAVALIHRQQADGSPALMVIDADGRPAADGTVANTALYRADVIGTPLAEQVFALTDAIYEQDDRFF